MMDFRFSSIRQIVDSNIKRICAAQDEVGLLLSGGEDSRAVAAMVPAGVRVRAVTFVDYYNREARGAEAISRRLGLDWRCVERSLTHYIEHAVESVRLVESHRFFIHAHLNGLSANLPPRQRCLGAIFSDSLFKACWASTHGRLGLTFGVRSGQVKYRPGCTVRAMGPIVAKEIRVRRELLYENMRSLRPESWAEFAAMVPGPSYVDLPHAIATRRLCFSGEPFLDARAVKLAAGIPQAWKLNRRLFHRAMKPVLRSTWNIRHANGIYPYFGLPVNAALLIVRGAWRRLGRLLGKPQLVDGTNEGPWPRWHELVMSQEFEALSSRASQRLHQVDALPEVLSMLLDPSSAVTDNQKLLRLQTLLWLESVFAPDESRPGERPS